MSDPQPRTDRIDAVVLNAEPDAWVFAEQAQRLSRALSIPIAQMPAAFNYVLGWDENQPLSRGRSFIPFEAIKIASDKRRLAELFLRKGVPTPTTHLFEDRDDVVKLLERDRSREWCLKWPTSCGASGHRLIGAGMSIPDDWPRPYMVQEFIRLENPAVFRTYAAGGELFGWNVRKFPAGTRQSEWVAHARGARYWILDEAPPEALAVARAALDAAGLCASFGCVDLLQRPNGEWLVLEVGTDGIHNHVDREVGDVVFEKELADRVAGAFWRFVNRCKGA